MIRVQDQKMFSGALGYNRRQADADYINNKQKHRINDGRDTLPKKNKSLLYFFYKSSHTETLTLTATTLKAYSSCH